MSQEKKSRRAFLGAVGGAAVTLSAGFFVPWRGLGSMLGLRSGRRETVTAMPRRRLGRTGLDVSLVALGGQGIIERRSRLPIHPSNAIINRAIDLGVNYIDTSPLYGAGLSEERIGNVMKSRRSEVFLATKTHDRTYDGTLKLFEQSLKRLQTDHVDLYQIHNVRLDSDLDQAFSRDGAVRAMERLRDEKAVRYLGITGHRDPAVLLRGIREYPFDTILMALNAADIHYHPFQTELLQTAVEKDMGVLAMKVTSLNRLFRDDGLSSMEDALGYVLSFPVTSAVIGISQLWEIEQDVQIAREFHTPFAPERLAQIESMTQAYREDANWYKIEWY